MADRIILFSPLPPKQNGIADYVFEQLPYLARMFEVVVVIEDAAPLPPSLPATIKVLRLIEYQALQSQFLDVTHIYHVGNNPDHCYMIPVLMKVPGVLVLHDLSLHYLVDYQTLARGNVEAYIWSLWQQYGIAGKKLGGHLRDFGFKGQFMSYELKLNGGLIHASRHVIVHSRYAQRLLKSEWPEKKIDYIPHHLSPAMINYRSEQRTYFKEALGLSKDKVILTSLGFIGSAKQVASVLKALSTLKSQGHSFFYVLAGQYRPDEYDVKHDIRTYGLENDVWVTGYLSEDQFFVHLIASDVIVNLRYPYGGETSGTLTRALGIGRCCVVVDIGAFGEMPDDCAVKIPWDENFQTELTKKLQCLIESPAQRQCYEVNARLWIRQYQSIRETTRAYGSVIRQCAEEQQARGTDSRQQMSLSVSGMRQRFLSRKAIAERAECYVDELQGVIHDGGGYLWWIEGLLAQAEQSSQLLFLTSQSHPNHTAIEKLFGYSASNVESMVWQSFIDTPLGANCFESRQQILVILPVSVFRSDLLADLIYLNWQLQLGGDLVLSLQLDEGTRHLLQPEAWEECMHAAGFDVLTFHEALSGASSVSFQSDKLEWACRLRKVSHVVERFPAVWYGDEVDEVASSVRVLPGFEAKLAALENKYHGSSQHAA